MTTSESDMKTKRETPRQRCLRLIEEYGGDFQEWDSDGLEGDVWSPKGVVWAATDCHTIAVSFYTDRPAGWKALLEDLEQGVVPCEQPDCDTCEDA
jgi:hypothetical protein